MNIDDSFGSFLKAIAFAARAHQHQLRKDKQTPYFSHVVRVAFIVRHLFGVLDEKVLMAAVLHDTIEDTLVDYDDLTTHFDPEIAGWVALLSKDKRLPDSTRESVYASNLKQAPWQVVICKLADIYDNLADSDHLSPDLQAKARKRARSYLTALSVEGHPEAVGRAHEMVMRKLACLDSSF